MKDNREGVWICDTTIREGGQSMGSSSTPQDLVAIAEAVVNFGVPFVECPWPVPEDELKEEEEKEAQLKALEFYRSVRQKSSKFKKHLVVFGSTMRKGGEAAKSKRLQAMVKTGLKNFAIFGKTDKRQVLQVLKASLKENLRIIRESVRFLKKQDGIVFYDAEHFFDGFLYDKAYALETIKAALEGGADRIIFCDTNGGMLPDQVSLILHRTLEDPKFSEELFKVGWGIHMHNDGELALANTLQAIDLGATYAQCTVNGESERVGMPKLTSLLPTLILKKKIECYGIRSLRSLKSLAEFVGERNNVSIPAHQPYIGDWAFAHKAGTHQAGARINPALQEHIKPHLVGARRWMPISGEAGKNAIAAFLKEQCGLEFDSNDPAIQKILNEVRRLDKKGFNLEAAPGTFTLIALKIAVGLKAPFKVTKIKPRSNLYNKGGQHLDVWEHDSKAEIEVTIEGENSPIRLWEEGRDGPVDAINNALIPALISRFPVLRQVQLVDYKVRRLMNNGKTGTASRVRVSVVGKTPFGAIYTAGMSENVLLASARALTDLYELVILKQQKAC